MNKVEIKINDTHYIIDQYSVRYIKNGKTRDWNISEFMRIKANTRKHSVALAAIKLKEWDK